MRILVTGGTGYLGGAIVRALDRRGHTPVVFARAASTSRLPGEAADGDVRDEAALTRAAGNCDAICHTAALVSVWRPRPTDFDDVNVGGLRHALRAASVLRTPRLVYTSSFLALPPSNAPDGRELLANDYQRTKVLARRVADEAIARGAPVIMLYPGVMYGAGRDTEGNLVTRLVRDHLRGRLPGLIGGDHIWSFAWVDAVADAHVTALERGTLGARYALGGDNAPQRRLFEIVRDLTGRRPPRDIPIPIARIAAIADEWRAAITRRPPLLTRGVISIFTHDWALDSSAAVRDLNYQTIPLADGVSALLRSLDV